MESKLNKKRLEKQMFDLKNSIENDQINFIKIIQLNLPSSAKFAFPGPINTPYQNFLLVLQFNWPNQYPMRPPKINFIKQIWNPYVDRLTGLVCMDNLNQNPSPALTTTQYILSVSSLLAEYKLYETKKQFLNPVAAAQMDKNYPYFTEKARKRCIAQNYQYKVYYTDQMRGIAQQHIVKAEGKKLQKIIDEQIKLGMFRMKNEPKQFLEIKHNYNNYNNYSNPQFIQYLKKKQHNAPPQRINQMEIINFQQNINLKI